MGPKISWRQRHNRINTHWSKNGEATQPLYVSYISCLQKKYWSSLVKGNVTDRGGGGENLAWFKTGPNRPLLNLT